MNLQSTFLKDTEVLSVKIYEKPVIEDDQKYLTVKVMLRELEDILGIEVDGTNLNKKENLNLLLEAIKSKLNK